MRQFKQRKRTPFGAVKTSNPTPFWAGYTQKQTHPCVSLNADPNAPYSSLMTELNAPLRLTSELNAPMWVWLQPERTLTVLSKPKEPYAMKNPTHPVGDRKSNASFWVTENQRTLLGGAETNQTHPCGWSARRWLVVGGDGDGSDCGGGGDEDGSVVEVMMWWCESSGDSEEEGGGVVAVMAVSSSEFGRKRGAAPKR
ncbi:hypothetical protein Tco_0551624 [Tanacetum coccineum]